MKKRIMAIIAVMMINLSWFAKAPTQQPNAVVPVALAKGVAVFGLIWFMMGTTKQAGELVDWAGKVAEKVGDGLEWYFSEEGQAYCAEQHYEKNVYQQYIRAYEFAQDIVDPAGLENGKVEIKYQDYLELCELMKVEIGLQDTVRMNYFGIEQDLTMPFTGIDYYRGLDIGESVYCIPYLIQDENVYLSDYSLKYERSSSNIKLKILIENGVSMKWSTNFVFNAENPLYKYTNTYYSAEENRLIVDIYEGSINRWYYDNITSCVMNFKKWNSSDVIQYTSNLKQGYIVSNEYPEAIECEVTSDYVPVEDLTDELDTILDITDNPTLIIDPASNDIKNDTVVSDIPGVNDVTVGELENGLSLNTTFDVMIPDLIMTKFPFSLPWDLYNLITIFEAEQKDPIFYIDINNTYGKGQGRTEYKNGVPHYYNGKGEEILFIFDWSIPIDLTWLPFLRELCHIACYVAAVKSMIYLTNKLTSRGGD